MRPGDEPIPGYRLNDHIGSGAFGTVWQANGPGGTPQALKFIQLNHLAGYKEWQALQHIKRLRHAHLLPVNGVWLLDRKRRVLEREQLRRPDEVSATMQPADQLAQWLVVATPLADKNLRDRMHECRRVDNGSEVLAGIPIDELLRYMQDAARAVDFLNRQQPGINHGDIKPMNLLLIGDVAVLCDFGLSRIVGTDQSVSAPAGSPAYMPPELIAKGKLTSRSDQYSLAIAYYELRTGTLPFSNSHTFRSVMKAHVAGRLAFDRVSPAERRVLERATHRKPHRRYANCDLLVSELRKAATGVASRTEQKGRRLSAVAAATAIVVLLAVVVLAVVLLAGGPGLFPATNRSPAVVGGPSLVRPVAPTSNSPIYHTTGRVAVPLVENGNEPAQSLLQNQTSREGQSRKAPVESERSRNSPTPEPIAVGGSQPGPATVATETTTTAPNEQPDSFLTGQGIRMVRVGSGSFQMGSPDDEVGRDSYERLERHTIQKAFYLAAEEVTVAQFREFAQQGNHVATSERAAAGGTGFDAERNNVESTRQARFTWRSPGWKQHPSEPIVNVSYLDAIAFCDWLSRQEGRRYRLPTGAEWEYACRAGTTTPFSSGTDWIALRKAANCRYDLETPIQPPCTQRVGSLVPNAWGFFDMHGNVAEWCSDVYEGRRAVRGGGWFDTPSRCRSAKSHFLLPDDCQCDIGFRIACDLPTADDERSLGNGREGQQ